MKSRFFAERRLDTLFAFIEESPISDRLLLKAALVAFIGALLAIGLSLNAAHTSQTPTEGGRLVEGVVGIPRFVNPALAVTRADKDMSQLVYDGLMRLNTDGKLVPHIAESVELQEDGRTYHIKLREDVYFHDGVKLTANDVAYTISLIQNPDLKSPLRGNWNDVLVEELSPYELNVVINEPYAPFIENFTIGIMPKHIWDDLPVEQLPFSHHNTEPVGSGPFEISNVVRDESGLITRYELSAFSDAIDPPNITEIEMRFFQNTDALDTAFARGEIMSTPSLSQSALQAAKERGDTITEAPLPRVFAIFFNQNRSAALRDNAARAALSTAVDRTVLVEDVLDGFGVPTDSPVPPSAFAVESETDSATATSSASSTTGIAAATKILKDGGWEQTESGWQKSIDGETVTLSATIATANTPLFEQTAANVATAWEELGVVVSVEQFEQADLLQGVIRPRSFETLLFGMDLGRFADLYPFWHSSQTEDPGLNIAQYTDIAVDGYLETLRSSTDPEAREEARAEVAQIIQEQHPAVFLFVPSFTYAVNTNVTTSAFTRINRPHERFANISAWHVASGNLWPMFRSE